MAIDEALMLKSLQEFFNKKSDTSASKQPQVDHDLKLAASTLMYEVIRSDGHIKTSELIAMGEILKQQFGFVDEDIDEMVALARQSSSEATCLQSFTREICDSWGNEKRARLLEYLWVISLADKVIHANERHLVRKVAGLLYLNEMQIVQARENAKQTLGIEDF